MSVAGLIGAFIGAGAHIAGNLINKKASAQQAQQIAAMNLKDAKSYYNYTRKGELADALKLMAKEMSYNKQLMSNSAKATVATNQQLMDYQYALERQSRQTSFLDTKKDLINAGYNPLLAVGQQSNYTPVSSGVSANSEGVEASNIALQKAGVASAISDMLNTTSATSSQVKRNNVLNQNETLAQVADSALKYANIGQVNSATRSQELQNDILEKTGLRRANAEIAEIGARTNLSNKQIQALQSQMNLNYLQGIVARSQTAKNEAESQAIQSSSAIMTQNYNSRQASYNRWAKKHPVYAGTLQGVGEITGALGKIFGANAGASYAINGK